MSEIKLLTPDELARLTKPGCKHTKYWKIAMEQRRAIWSPYIIKPEMEFFHVDKINDRPSEEGIYGLFDETGFLLYIGKSTGTRYRLTQHQWAMERGKQAKFTFCAVLPVPGYLLRDVEVAHIHALRPVANNLYERSRCEWHEDMVKEIRKIWEIAEECV